MRLRLIVCAGLCAVLVALLGGCASAVSTGGAAPADATGSPGAATAPSATGPGAVSFRGSTVDGAPFDGAELAGTPVVLWFWAPY